MLGTGVSARAAKGKGGREQAGGAGDSKTWGIGDDRGRCMPIPGEAIIASNARAHTLAHTRGLCRFPGCSYYCTYNGRNTREMRDAG